MYKYFLVIVFTMVISNTAYARELGDTSLLPPFAAMQQENDSSEKSGKTVHFRFLVQPGRTAAAIDWVKVVDAETNQVVGFLDLGAGDTTGDSHVLLSEIDHWGDRGITNGVGFRYVNGKEAPSEHSGFVIGLQKYDANTSLKLLVRYQDAGTDLMPIEVDFGSGFVRVGQILLENSGQWMEDEFDLP